MNNTTTEKKIPWTLLSLTVIYTISKRHSQGTHKKVVQDTRYQIITSGPIQRICIILRTPRSFNLLNYEF